MNHTWHTPVDNGGIVFQNWDRNCAKFAFHRCSAIKKNRKKGLSDPKKNLYGMQRQIGVLRLIQVLKASQGNFWNRFIGSFVYWIKPKDNA